MKSYIDATTFLNFDPPKKKVKRGATIKGFANYSDQFLPWDPNRKISFQWRYNSVKNSNGEIVDEETLHKVAEDAAKAFGRIPAYLRADWSIFSIDSCKLIYILNKFQLTQLFNQINYVTK